MKYNIPLAYRQAYCYRPSVYIGKVGMKIELEVTVCVVYLSFNGGSFAYVFEDEAGNTLVWETAKDLTPLTFGDVVTLKGRVKKYLEYFGRKETHLYYCKVTRRTE